MSIVVAQLNSSAPPQICLHTVFDNKDYHALLETNDETALLDKL